MGNQWFYNHTRVADPVIPPESEPAAVFVVRIGIDQRAPEYTLTGFDGQMSSTPLRELPAAAGKQHGWTKDKDIVVACDFRPAEGQARDGYWEEVTGELAEVALHEGVSVYFPGRGSAYRCRYGASWSSPGEPIRAGSGATHRGVPRGLYRTRLAGCGSGPQTGFVSLTLAGRVAVRAASCGRGWRPRRLR